MHHAWSISHGGRLPTTDPHGTGITWDHGDAAKTKQAAAAMRDAFNMAYDASVTSRHITGNAIDTTITWTSDLSVKNAMGEDVAISTLPRHGGIKKADGTKEEGNALLHEVGASYGVHKLKSDPPHWSSDGR